MPEPGTKISLLATLAALAAGDVFPVVDISDTSMAASGTTKYISATNLLAGLATLGAVTGPSSATGNAITRYDSTTGKLIQNSLAILDDSGSVLFPVGQGIKGISSGLFVYDSSGNIRIDTGPGAAVIWSDNTLSYDARTWYVNNGVSGGAANALLLHTNMSSSAAPVGIIFYDDGQASYPMGVAYYQDQGSPPDHQHAHVGFVDDTLAYNFLVDDAGYGQINNLKIMGDLQLVKTGAVGAVTVTPQGTTGSTSYSYKVVVILPDGSETEASSTGSTSTGNATLNGTNFNRLSWDAHTNGARFMQAAAQYKIYRTASGGTPSTTGLIATVTAFTNQFDDTGLAGDSSTPPAVNSTGNLLAAGAIKPGVVTVANLPVAPAEGMHMVVTDSSTATWGATISGGGANRVLAYFNGTNWTVAAK